jgi:hypothetical protein
VQLGDRAHDPRGLSRILRACPGFQPDSRRTDALAERSIPR